MLADKLLSGASLPKIALFTEELPIAPDIEASARLLIGLFPIPFIMFTIEEDRLLYGALPFRMLPLTAELPIASDIEL